MEPNTIKRKCPKGADFLQSDNGCPAVSPDEKRFKCTRAKGHRGPHHAHGLGDYWCYVWKEP